MAKRLEIYVCELCGNVVEVLDGADGELVCCGQAMDLQKENSVDAAKEKHVPVVKRDGNTVVVEVGAVPHPMEAKHNIAWIELSEGNTTHRTVLTPGDKPTATFAVAGDTFTVRAFCNLHGLWVA